MSGNYGLYFNVATGTWDTLSNWKAEGYYNGNQPKVPDSGSSVYLLSTVQDLLVTGSNDQAASIFATGSSASGNEVDISGTLNVGGMASFTSFNVDVAHGGAFDVSQLALANAVMEVSGDETVSNGGGVTLNNATIVVEAGGTMSAPEIENPPTATLTDRLIVDGTLYLTGGGPGVDMMNTINSGGLVVMDGDEQAGTVWNVNGGTYSSPQPYENGTFNFTGTGGLLDLPADTIYNTGVTVTGFNATDAIILGSATGTGAVTAELVNGNTLQLVQGGAVVGQIDSFTLASGTSISEISGSVIDGHYVVNHCFYAGTRLATADGEIEVQDVQPGTMLKTASGKVLPVRWLGWSEVATRFADPLRSLPIRIRAGALEEGVPARDLLVSPDHAIFVEGVLVQAGALVNGVSIIREEDVPESFRYYHVELATHELLLAEGCPAESFVDNVDRMHFHNWDAREAPDEAVEEMAYARAKSARQVPAALRRAIAARMHFFLAPQAA
jgi:hypothetical protein